MRINTFIARSTGLSRRAADEALTKGRVTINRQLATLGSQVAEHDRVTLDGRAITPSVKTTLLLNKPVGYVCSRAGQGSSTIYALLPAHYHGLKPVGRLDKDSSGLLLLTNDGLLANQLAHPRYAKTKVYEVTLDKALAPQDRQLVTDSGVALDDGPSKLGLEKLDQVGKSWRVTMQEGRNRQIRRTFATLGYTVQQLNRVQFGDYKLDDVAPGRWAQL